MICNIRTELTYFSVRQRGPAGGDAVGEAGEERRAGGGPSRRSAGRPPPHGLSFGPFAPLQEMCHHVNLTRGDNLYNKRRD